MSLRQRFVREALGELTGAAKWYELRQPGLGRSLVEAVDAAVETVTGWPSMGRLVGGLPSDVMPRRMSVAGFPYSVVYEVDDNLQELVVLAVAHDRQEPGYWFGRVGEGAE